MLEWPGIDDQPIEKNGKDWARLCPTEDSKMVIIIIIIIITIMIFILPEE